MLVLLSFALVLVATVLLVLGLLNDDGLTLIYVSMASSLAAAIVLVVAYRLNKPRTEQRAVAPAPLPVSEPVPATVGASATAASPTLGEEPAAAPSGGEWLATDQGAWGEGEDAGDGWQEGDEVEFPIADYDTLTVGQILPLLPQLYTDEIDVVEERERLTKARPQVLAKLAELRDASGAAEEPAVAIADPLAAYTEPAAAGWDDDDDWFPIEDYESLSAAQIRPLLPELDPEELTLVRTRELALGRRRSLLDEIDRMLGVAPAPAPAPARRAAPATRPTAASKAPAARRTAASTAPAAKKAATKAPTKAAAKKATATKAPSTKVAATKKAAPAKKTSPAAKTAAKKAAPTKAAPTKAAAAKKGTLAKKATAPAKKSTKR